MAKAKKKNNTRRGGNSSFFWGRFVGVAVLVACALYALNIALYLVWPPVGALVDTNPSTTAFMEFRRDQWTQKGRRISLRRTWVPLSAISPHLRRAVTAAEDAKFWNHEGFDWDGISNAMTKNIASGRLSAGGSTITQQLAKNLYLSPKKTFTRKFQEAILVWRLENTLSKGRILEIYLNVVEWGDGIFGVEAAARRYFGIAAAQLSQRQSAVLAAMLPAPLVRTPGSRQVQALADVIEGRM